MLSTKMVSGLLGIHYQTLHHWVQDRKIEPPIKGLGGAYLWQPEDIEAAKIVRQKLETKHDIIC